MLKINKILFITLSNIGDVILTLPALDVLLREFPDAEITVMVGPRAKEIFENHPNIDRVIVFDKHIPLRGKIKLFNSLSKEKFNAVIDFRNSFFGALVPAKYKSSPFRTAPKNVAHMKERHLYKLQDVVGSRRRLEDTNRESLWISKDDREYIVALLKENNIGRNDKIIIIAPGAKSHIKRWDKDKFAELCKRLSEGNIKIIFAGNEMDKAIADYIIDKGGCRILNLCGNTKIAQLAALLKESSLLITNDSAVMHIASYLNMPVLSIFGPTNELKYGPWSGISSLVKKDISCRPCEKAQCKSDNLKCMRLIKVEDVFKRVEELLNSETRIPSPESRIPITDNRNVFKRILIVRTDRIGDVLLSTPVIEALREAYPYAYIAMMVSPYAKEIVEGNPYLDETILYDKDCAHKNWVNSVKFAYNLKKLKFDLALVLHPTNRVNLITFFAGIKRRVGYDRKYGFLLTDRIQHTKQWGEKHELEYALDLVRYLGIEPKNTKLYMPIKVESEDWVNELFVLEDLKLTDALLGIHPAASCPSKIWPVERFAQVADALAQKYGFKILVLSGPKDRKLAETLINLVKHKAVNLAGKTSVSQLASLLKRCNLFISNDSGPVHIASAVGTPVISIFGRNQKGLSPKRWGPVGNKDIVLHKEVGCSECLAHNCAKEFACLKAITVDEVFKAAEKILEAVIVKRKAVQGVA